MNKYIPADKVLAEIERLEHENCMNGGEHFCMRRAICLGNLRNIITPLYHEQQESELEKAARHVYESWMGGTMNDFIKDMKALGNVLNARKEE